MTRNGRFVVLAIAAMAIVAGLLLFRAGGGIPFLMFGILIMLTVFLEPRYRRGTPASVGPGWQQTGERFRDEESGDWMEVWFRPESGERRYVPIAREAHDQQA